MLATSSSAASGPGMANPNMVQSIIVQNGFLDRHLVTWRKNQKQYYSPFGDVNAEEAFDLKTRELCFALKKSNDSFVQRNINPQKDHELRVFSSANGLPDFFSNPRDQKYDVGNIRDAISFVGVPLVDIRAGNENQSDAVAIMVSGSTTIFNTGPYEIGIGDIVIWDLPAIEGEGGPPRPAPPYGIVTRKKLFRTIPLSFASLGSNGASQSAASGDTVDGLYKSLQLKKAVGGVQRVDKGGFDTRRAEVWRTLVEDVQKQAPQGPDSDAFKDAVGNLLLGWTAEWESLMKRRIGYALSNARPGQQFDSESSFTTLPASPVQFSASHDVFRFTRVIRTDLLSDRTFSCADRSSPVQVKTRIVEVVEGAWDCARGVVVAQSRIVSVPNMKRKLGAPLQSDDAFLHVLDDEERVELRKNRDAWNKQCYKRPFDNPFKGQPVTLSSAIATFNLYCEGTGEPLDESDPNQLKHWVSQSPSACGDRTILFRKLDGTLKTSMCIRMIPHRGRSAASLIAGKINGRNKTSAARRGGAAFHSMEMGAVFKFFETVKRACADTIDEWELETVFDGMLADCIIRHASWPKGEYVGLQIKSSSVAFGKQSRYGKPAGTYPDFIYCVGIGLLGYTPNVPDHPDDMETDARLYEFWALGTIHCAAPMPGILYTSVDPSRRTFVSHRLKGATEADHEAYVRAGAMRFLDELKAWPADRRRTRDQLLYELIRNDHNERLTEMRGIRIIADLVESAGGLLRAPYRQNETTDTVLHLRHICVYVSHKTASATATTNRFYFTMSKQKNSHLCDVVVAMYREPSKKVMVVSRDTVYNGKLQNFGWNESYGIDALASRGIRIFHLDDDAERIAFLEHLCTFGKPQDNRKMPLL